MTAFLKFYLPRFGRAATLLLLSALPAQPGRLAAQAIPSDKVAGNTARISVPGTKGVLEINVGITDWDTQVRDDGLETKLEAMHRPDDLLISAFIQKVNFPASAESCRHDWWPKTKKAVPFKRDDLRETEVKDGIARVEFILHKFRDRPIEQKNIHAYLGGGTVCAEVHLSRVQFRPEQQQIFEDVLSTVRLLPDAAGAEAQSVSREEMTYLGEASRYYLQKDYAAAARSYQKALDMEKRDRALNPNMFRVLVDNLGMAYAFTGKLDKAKEIFGYGITQDPEYPMFYYNMACTYGEVGKMDEAIEQLRLAYKYRANMIPGEGGIPDPLKDDSFRRFAQNEKFVQTVHEMQQ